MRIYINGIIGTYCLCGFNQLAYGIIAVRSAGILSADGHLLFRTFQSVADAPHIDRYCLGNSARLSRGTALADLFINGNVHIHTPR